MRDPNLHGLTPEDALARLALDDALASDPEALAAALRDDPDLARALRDWRRVRGRVRQDLARDLPDRDLLVLHALADGDALTPDERSRLADADLDAALAAHPGIAAAVQRIQADRDAFATAWDEAGVPASVAERASLRPARARDRAPAPSLTSASRRPVRWVWRSAALAAVTAFAVLATWLYQRDAGFDRIVADAAQTVTLPDGSVADLAAGAVLYVPTSDTPARQARLTSGTALFQVVPDGDAPFRLQTANAEITVLGTTFGVEASEVQTEVALVAGSVSLAPRRQPEAAVRLAPGQRARVLAADAPSAPTATDGDVLAWTGAAPEAGPAGAIAERIGTRFGVAVVLDEALAAEVVAGRFDAEASAGEALQLLALALGADFTTDDSTTYRLTDGR